MQSSQTRSNSQNPPGISGSGSSACSAALLDRPSSCLQDSTFFVGAVSQEPGNDPSQWEFGFVRDREDFMAGAEPLLRATPAAAKSLAIFLLNSLPLRNC